MTDHTDPADHTEGWVVWDGRAVVAEFDGPTADTDAAAYADRLRDAGNPDVRRWAQRTCAWVDTTLRADPSHVEALSAGGQKAVALQRRLTLIVSAHRPKGSTCSICTGEPWPCPTHRIASTTTDP